MKRILWIDILRINSFFAIFLFHSRFPLYENAYLGVEVFIFVSGYLLASKNYLNLADFWSRRERSLLPSYLVFSCFVFLGIFLFQFSEELLSSLYVMLLTPVALAPYYLSQNVGYFGIDSVVFPVMHLWSLSVEIVCYCLFSIIFLVSNKSIKAMLFLMVVVGITINDFMILDQYFNISSRAVFFFAGAIVARNFGKETHNLSIFVLLLFLISGVSGVGLEFALPRLIVLFILIICTAFLSKTSILSEVSSDTTKTHFSSIKYYFSLLVRSSSKRVYLYYLFHYPLFSFEALALGNSYFNYKEIVIVFILTILISELIYRLKDFNFMLVKGKVIIFCLFFCIAAFATNGFNFRFENEEIFEFVNTGGKAEFSLNEESSLLNNQSICVHFIGDSHARQLYYLYKNSQISSRYTKTDILNLEEVLIENDRDCQIFVSFRWSGEVLSEVKQYFSGVIPEDITFIQEWPVFNIDLRRYISLQNNIFIGSRYTEEMLPQISRQRLNHDESNWSLVMSTPGVKINNIQEKLCNNESCITGFDGKLLYRDSNHISEMLNKETSEFLIQLLEL